MTRKEAISHIEALYPADSQWDGARQVGRKLLEQAKKETTSCGWRELSDATLIRYAEFCQAYDNAEPWALKIGDKGDSAWLSLS